MKSETQLRLSRGVSDVLVACVRVIAAFGSAFMVAGATVLAMGGQAAHAAMVADGPSPAAQTSANMPQARLTIHYNRIFMKFLYANLNKLLMCTHMDLPEKSGQTFRNFMAIPLPADLQQQTEGTIGPPEQINVDFNDIVVGQWANYNNISDLAFMTSISDDLENNRQIMAYQLGLTIDDLINAMMNYLRIYDTRTANQDSATTPYQFSKNIIEQMPGSLSGATVPPMKDGWYNGSIHPFFVSDMAIDDTNNSIVDIWKHTDSGQLKLEELTDPGATGDQPTKIIELFGCHWRQSTNQTQVANWEGSGETAIYTYLAGMDAIVFVNFPNKRHTTIDPRWMNMNLWAGEYKDRTAYDPNGLILGGTGYNCVLGIGLPPDTTSRMRIAGAVPQTT
jgi:methionine-rich copper-binding protein CopC